MVLIILENQMKILNLIFQDPVTGKAEQTFRTPYTLQHKIGGLVQVSSQLERLKHKRLFHLFSALWNEIFRLLCSEQLQKTRILPNIQSFTTLHVII